MSSIIVIKKIHSNAYRIVSSNPITLRRLDKVRLEELLEVQVRHLLVIADTEQLGELRIGHDAALVGRVEAPVGLDVLRHKLGHIRLRALGLGGQTHEGRHLVGEQAGLQERVVRAAGLPGSLLLGRHRRGVLAHTALGLADRALHRLGRLRRLSDQGAHTTGHLGVQGAQRLLDTRQNRIGTASLGRQRGRGSDRRGTSGGNRRGSRGGGRGGNRHGHIGLRGGLGGSLLGNRHRV